MPIRRYGVVGISFCLYSTLESHPENRGVSFGCGQAIWRNKGDCGYVYDAGGAEVAQYCY